MRQYEKEPLRVTRIKREPHPYLVDYRFNTNSSLQKSHIFSVVQVEKSLVAASK